MDISLNTPDDTAITLSKRIKALRLLKKWKRSTLAKKSGVTEASLRRFEQTGKVSLDNFLKLAFTLGRLDEANEILKAPVAQSISDLEKQEKRTPKRGTL